MRHKRVPAYTFTVEFPAPLDIPASLEIFRRTGDDGIDRWDGRVLVRTTRVTDTVVPFICTVLGTVDAPALEVTVAHATHAAAVERAMQTMFVTAPEALAALIAIDPVIARLELRYPGLRPVLQSDFLTALIRAISAQQVNLQWATTTRRRLAEAFGGQHTLGPHQVFSLTAARLATVDVAALRALQFTTRKAEYIIALATAVATGTLDLAALRDQPAVDHGVEVRVVLDVVDVPVHVVVEPARRDPHEVPVVPAHTHDRAILQVSGSPRERARS